MTPCGTMSPPMSRQWLPTTCCGGSMTIQHSRQSWQCHQMWMTDGTTILVGLGQCQLTTPQRVRPRNLGQGLRGRALIVLGRQDATDPKLVSSLDVERTCVPRGLGFLHHLLLRHHHCRRDWQTLPESFVLLTIAG